MLASILELYENNKNILFGSGSSKTSRIEVKKKVDH